ncbi:MAG: (d)CMP kinase, partial [Victivallales bacterium]|nr:(d)CMP kinase [Victivallales bacterium]
AQIAMRDQIDSTREIAPLKPAPDALIINTDNMTPDEVVDKIIEFMRENPRQ